MLQTFLIIRSKNGIYIWKTVWFARERERQRQRESTDLKMTGNLFQMHSETESDVKDEDQC